MGQRAAIIELRAVDLERRRWPVVQNDNRPDGADVIKAETPYNGGDWARVLRAWYRAAHKPAEGRVRHRREAAQRLAVLLRGGRPDQAALKDSRFFIRGEDLDRLHALLGRTFRAKNTPEIPQEGAGEGQRRHPVVRPTGIRRVPITNIPGPRAAPSAPRAAYRRAHEIAGPFERKITARHRPPHGTADDVP
jgi:hypothetical protein